MQDKIIVFDIDGTVADISHRVHHVQVKPKNWKEFDAAAHLDTLIEPIAALFNLFQAKNKILFCTGRSDNHREATRKWLLKHDLYHDELYMRKHKDYREDSIVKVELLQQIRKDYGEPYLWFDDRDRVVAAIRAQGVKVLQVAEGGF